MSTSCRNYKEVDTNSGMMTEYCKGRRAHCGCSGLLAQCDYPSYFNVPEHRWGTVRMMEQAQRLQTYAELGVQK